MYDGEFFVADSDSDEAEIEAINQLNAENPQTLSKRQKKALQRKRQIEEAKKNNQPDSGDEESDGSDSGVDDDDKKVDIFPANVSLPASSPIPLPSEDDSISLLGLGQQISQSRTQSRQGS